jgi:hypothetical protein
MKRYLSALMISIMFIVGVSLVTPDGAYAQSAEYSCGTYGTGNYSTGNDCSGADTGGDSDGASAPNTGFAALIQPSNAIPLGLSVLAIIAGILLIFKKKRRNKIQF